MSATEHDLAGRQHDATPTPPAADTPAPSPSELADLDTPAVVSHGRFVAPEATAPPAALRPTRRFAALLGFLAKGEVYAIFQQLPYHPADPAADPLDIRPQPHLVPGPPRARGFPPTRPVARESPVHRFASRGFTRHG